MKLNRLLLVLSLSLLGGCGQPPDGLATDPAPGATTEATPSGAAVLGPRTRVLRESLATLHDYDAERGSLRLAASAVDVAGLAAGDVIAAPPSLGAPSGLLRHVRAVRVDGAELVLDTEVAPLTEALESASVHVQKSLTAADVAHFEPALPGIGLEEGAALAPGVRAQGLGINDPGPGFVVKLDHVKIPASCPANVVSCRAEVVLNGTATLPIPQLVFELELGWFKIQHFAAGVVVQEGIDADVQGTAGVTFHQDIPLGTITIAPIVVWAGPFPIVLVPSIVPKLGLDGRLSFTASFHVRQHGVAAGIAAYDDGRGWSTDRSGTRNEASISAPQFERAEAFASAYLQLDAGLRLYDVAGAKLVLAGGVELSAVVPRTPLAQADAFVRGAIGFDVRVLSFTLASYTQPLFDQRWTIWQSDY